MFYPHTQLGHYSGISFIDSSALAVCRNPCIHQHRIFAGRAACGKTSMGWFYSFKQHADETGIRVYGMLHSLHVNCTHFLTHLAWHVPRGQEAMDEIGIWPRFAGRGMHDRWVSYDAYAGAHSICGAHLVRDCTSVAQQEHQQWATEMQDFLLDLHNGCHEWRLHHLSAVPTIERDDWITRYFEILATGYAA